MMAKHDRTITDTAQAERIGGALWVLEALPPAEPTAVAAFVLDVTGAGYPQLHLYEDLRQTAALWADAASHLELEVYFVAALHRLGRTPLALGQRKRLFGLLWRTFSDDERRAFLAKTRRAS